MFALEKQPNTRRGTAVQRPGALSFDDPDEAWVCAVCDASISGQRHAFSMRAGGLTQVFPSPHAEPFHTRPVTRVHPDSGRPVKSGQISGEP